LLAKGNGSSKKPFARRIMVATFIHTFRWGWQIRGDERGFIEKVKGYKDLGVEFFTIEREPSLQDGMGEHLYTSLTLGNSPVPPRNLREMALLTLHSLRAGVRKYPSRPLGIYAYNQDIENLWVAYLLKVLIGAPMIIVYHQIRPASFVSFGNGIVDRTRRGFNPLSAILRSTLPALNRFAARHADVHIALSEATRAEVERYLGIKDCVVIGNGLDTAKFHPMVLPKTIDAAFLGRLAPQKGIDVLLEAWSELVRRRPGSHLVLLGGGEPKDVSLFRKMARELHLEESVTFKGFVDDDQVVRLLNSSKLFVFPSRKEGFAQAVSQAMGCGLCCVLSDIPPLREVYGSAATFVPVDQPSALAEKIEELLGAENERLVLAERARQLSETFSWDASVRQELAQLSRHWE
jgi:glycosyltransferase involved in cell wall biosynthesis